MSGEKLSLFTSIPVNKRPKTDNEQVFKEMVTLITNKQISTGKLVDFAQMLQDMAAAGIVISGNQVAIKGDKVTIYNKDEVALFAQDGKLNANLINADTITVNHLYAKSAQGGSVVGHFGNYDKSDAVVGDTQCPLWLGAATAANAPFRVSKEGAMYAVAGTIGGFTISSSDLKWSSSSSINKMTLMGDGVLFSNGKGDHFVGKVEAAFGTSTLDGTHAMYPVLHISQKLDHNSAFARNIAMHIDVTGNIPESASSNSTLGDYCPGNHALLIENGDIAGLRLKAFIADKSYTISKYDGFILNTATNDNTVYTLPSPADSVGQVIFIANKYNYTCVVKGSIYNRGYASAVTVERYGMAIFISDGYHWIFKWFKW